VRQFSRSTADQTSHVYERDDAFWCYVPPWVAEK
jgi:hypothetical protein